MTHNLEVTGGFTKGVWQPLDGIDAADQDAVALQE